jgi:FkbM family methyltransferase
LLLVATAQSVRSVRPEVQPELIYDVGVNDGADTAYYLHRGFRVIGIEASPVAVEQLRQRFAEEIADGSFTLLNLGVAEEEGEFPFWVCEDHPEWSSFDRRFAERQDCRHHSVTVKTRKFGDIIAEHGVPYFCKIDIEGNDTLCVEGLSPDTAPPYISIEMSHEAGNEALKLLNGLGYKYFKIISQSTWTPPSKVLSGLAFRLPIGPWLLLRASKKLRRTDRLNGWRFPFGASGPFAEETRGRWINLEEVLSLWRFLRDIDARHGTKGLGDWYDIHARL